VRENLVATASNRCKRQSPWDLGKIYALFPRMQERADQTAGTLSGGEQQMLAIGRALMTNPHLLILDEATEGLAPVIRTEIWHCIMQLREMGQSILLIDKNIAVLKKLADRHYIVEKGRTVWRGTSADLERDREQVHAYVGI
jgi:branched-chain amino acid transport system ATP-binding protein